MDAIPFHAGIGTFPDLASLPTASCSNYCTWTCLTPGRRVTLTSRRKSFMLPRTARLACAPTFPSRCPTLIVLNCPACHAQKTRRRGSSRWGAIAQHELHMPGSYLAPHPSLQAIVKALHELHSNIESRHFPVFHTLNSKLTIRVARGRCTECTVRACSDQWDWLLGVIHSGYTV